MKLKTLHKIFGNQTVGETQGIAIRHKAGIRFFTGKESEQDPANYERYPLFYLAPASVTKTIRDGVFTNVWSVTIEIVDILPTDRDADRVNEILDRLHDIFEDILLFFFLNYNNSFTVTFDGLAQKLDFDLSDINMVALIDTVESNLTGWQATFTITEQINPSDVACRLEENFD